MGVPLDNSDPVDEAKLAAPQVADAKKLAETKLAQQVTADREGPFGFHGGDDREPTDGKVAAGPRQAEEPRDIYGQHGAPDDTRVLPPVRVEQSLNLNPEQAARLLALPQDGKLSPYIYDMATKALRERARITGEPVNKDAIYHECNRIMILNGYPAANLEGRNNINDKMLPKAWNNVKVTQQFKLYDTETLKALAAQARPPERLADDTGRDRVPEISEPPPERSVQDIYKANLEKERLAVIKRTEEQITYGPVKKGDTYEAIVSAMFADKLAKNPDGSFVDPRGPELIKQKAAELKTQNGGQEPREGSTVRVFSDDQTRKILTDVSAAWQREHATTVKQLDDLKLKDSDWASGLPVGQILFLMKKVDQRVADEITNLEIKAGENYGKFLQDFSAKRYVDEPTAKAAFSIQAEINRRTDAKYIFEQEQAQRDAVRRRKVSEAEEEERARIKRTRRQPDEGPKRVETLNI